MNTLNAKGIKSVDVLDAGCKFTSLCPDYEGMYVFDANKPILRMHDGKLELAGKTRTQSKAFAKLTELVVERAAREPVFAAIQHADVAEAAGQLGAMLEEGLPPGSRVMLEPLVDVLAVHTGPGAIGLSVVFSSQEPTQ